MTDSHSRFAAHEQRLAHSYALLRDARNRARSESKYDSVATREKMIETCKAKTGLIPRAEQLDIAECLLLGLDATLIAGTGWGKTLAFALPSFLEKRKVTIIISPLNVLEVDQASRFCSWDLPAIGLNGNTYTDDVHKDIEVGKYRIIVVGPELCVDGDSRFRALLSKPAFSKQVSALIVDEAHCITQWGTGFRPKYAELDTLRALLRIRVPVLLASATMPPVSLAQARCTMHIDDDHSFHLNLGNDRANISWEVRYMSGGKTDLEALQFLVPQDVTEVSCLVRAIIFFDDILLSMRALRWFREQVPSNLRERVQCYHARRGQLGKDITFEEFRTGRVDILFATESAGMGCDIPDIELIVQFMAPESLSIWFQRAGRAGRSADIQARAILLIQPSVFHEKGKATRKDGDPIEYVKQLEPGLRLWVSPPPGTCRRDIADEYFDNPQRCAEPTGMCCDVCVERAETQELTFIIETGEAGASRTDVEMSSMSALRGVSGSQPAWRAAVPVTRANDYLSEAVRVLQDWRQRTWLALYNVQPYGPRGVLPDPTLKSLAARTTYLTTSDLDSLSWHHAQRHGEEVLAVLHALDRKRAVDVLAEEAQKRAASEAKKEAERRERDLKAQQKRDAKALEKTIADQKKKTEKEQAKIAKAQRKVEELARKQAEKAAVKESKRVQKERQKADEKARKAVEKAEKQAERARERAEQRGEASATSCKRKRVNGEKENEARGDGCTSASKRVRVDEESSALPSPASPLLPVSTAVSQTNPSIHPPHPRPKPRPVRKTSSTAPPTPASPSRLAVTVTPARPSSMDYQSASAAPPPPSTPYRPLATIWPYPTPYSPVPALSLARFMGPGPTTPSPFAESTPSAEHSYL